MDNQHPDGYWLSPATKGIETDRNNMRDIDNKVYSTTLCALQLTVYYRYLPSSVIKKSGGDKSNKKQTEAATGEEVINIF